MIDFIKDFCDVIGRIVEEEKYVQYTRESKGAGLYYKIEQPVFEKYVNDFSRFKLGEFVKQCSEYGLIKSEKNRVRSCIYWVGNKKFYFVNKLFIDAALKNTDRCEV